MSIGGRSQAVRRGAAAVARSVVWLLIGGLCARTGAASPGEALYRFSPAPQWVKPLAAEYDAPIPSSGVSDGTWDLLFDRQIKVTADGDEYYQHSAARVISTSGVDARSQIDVSID